LIATFDDKQDVNAANALKPVIGGKVFCEVLLRREFFLNQLHQEEIHPLYSVVKKCFTVNEENRGPLSSEEFEIFGCVLHESEPEVILLVSSNIH